MCSIYGALEVYRGALDRTDARDRLARLRDAARDRGRDGHGEQTYALGDGRLAVLGAWRGAPTPEIVAAPRQPYDGLTHNGTIANDAALGAQPGEVDSMALARHVDRSSVVALARSLDSVVGSYALACVSVAEPAFGTVYLAANYKPLYYLHRDGVVYWSSLTRHFDTLRLPASAPVALAAYTALDLTTFLSAAIHVIHRDRRAVVVCSGGLDSTTVAAKLLHDGYDVCLLHILYGARAESREAALIPQIAARLECEYAIVDATAAYDVIGGSNLLTAADTIAGGVAGAEFAHEWVPARNLVLYALAVAYAESHNYGVVALGNNLEEAGAYPDNEEELTLRLDALLPYAVKAHTRIHAVAPVGHLMKHEIVRLGAEVGTPFDLTWSCYRAGATPCGECGPCYMRRVAFERAGVVDPLTTGAAHV